MTEQILVARTLTGEVLDALDDPDWSFDDALEFSDAGSMTLQVPLPGAGDTGVRTQLRAIARAMSGLSIVVVEDGTALWGGPVASMGWDDEGVDITCAGLGWIFDRRVLVQHPWLADPTNPSADIALQLLPRDLVLQLLALATTGPRRGLPLTIPAQGTDAGSLVTFRGADLKTAAEAIKEAVEADGGPDLMFQPQVTEDLSTISWAVAVGEPQLGAVNPDAVWDFPLVAISGDIDDSETADTAYVLGDSAGGDDDTRFIGVHQTDRPDWPSLERADRTTVAERRPDRLAALARSYGETYAWAVEEITLAAPVDAGPAYRQAWNLGDTGRFSVTGHPWLDDADVARRIIAVSRSRAGYALTTTGPAITVTS